MKYITKIIGIIDYKIKIKDNKEYHINFDEGGMMGIPKVTINNKKTKDYYIGKMSKYTLKKHIIGRLLGWKYGRNEDWSNKILIIDNTI